MNKKELIKKYEASLKDHSPFNETVSYTLIVSHFLDELKRLDEPEKVKVSEEEAKFLKTFDFNHESDVTTALYRISRTGWGYYLTDNDSVELKDLTKGFRDLENRKRLIKAVLDGYEVEKEPKYTVKFKATNQYLCDDDGIGLHISPSFRSNFRKSDLEKLSLTEVFDSPLFEVKEVEE